MGLTLNISAAVLAGGLSSRFPSDKTQLSINGENIVAHAVNRLKPLFQEIFVVVNRPDRIKELPGRCEVDLYPKTGPLGAVYTGLSICKSDWLFVMAGDMPFVTHSFIRWAASKMSENIDAIIPKDEKRLQPLCAFYRKNCLTYMKKELESGSNWILGICPHISLLELKISTFPEIKENPNLFFNINTKEDWNLYLQLSKSSKI